jgi:cytochrome P450
MSTGYSGKENLHMEDDVDVRLLQLFDLIDSRYVSTEDEYRPVDISRLYSYFTLDVISSIAFGQEFGFLKHDEDPFGYIENLQEFLPAIIVFGAYPELQKILRLPLVKHVMPKATDKRGLGRVMGFAKERVNERFGIKAVVRDDMLGSFIKRGLSQEQLESETLTQITAGSDSTASAIRMTLHFVSTTPHVHSRLVSEFKRALANGQVSRPVIRDVEARALPYLQACIKEGLRMYPPVTGLLAKAVPAEGAIIDGKFVKGGTQIAWNSWGMQRDKDIYGVDAEIFRPERWLLRDGSESEMKRVARMTETVGLVFGYGRFGCLGRGVANMELNKGIIEVGWPSMFETLILLLTQARSLLSVTNFNLLVFPSLLSSDVWDSSCTPT